MNYEWAFFVASWESLLAFVMLCIASFMHYGKEKNRLLILGGVGFLVAAMGRLYQEYLNRYPGVPQNLGIEETFNFLNEQIAYSSLATAMGLTLAGFSYLFFVIKK